MDRSECIKCLAVLKQNYFSSFHNLGANDAKDIVSLWELQFKDNSYEEVMNAINYIISTSEREFAPPIGVIKARIVENKIPERLSVSSAWDMVVTACGKPDGFQSLPKIIQKAVGSSRILRSWGEADINTFNSSIMASFRKNYEKVLRDEKEQLSLPSSVKADIERISQNNILYIGG